ncbi:MAG: hypothetical protein HYW88_02770 [Candidatus Sungbacteria bacterium]|nr:hypothetical protein [Candidatus Sungbacteria bacterium]
MAYLGFALLIAGFAVLFVLKKRFVGCFLLSFSSLSFSMDDFASGADVAGVIMLLITIYFAFRAYWEYKKPKGSNDSK